MAASSGHIKWLDLAYVLSMLCVVWFHIPSDIEDPIRNIEWVMVNVPFFFFSGIAFKINHERHAEVWKKSYMDFVKDRFVKMVLPTTCFYYFFYVLWLVLGKSLAGDSEGWYVPLYEFVTGQYSVVLATFWFVVALLVQQILVFTLFYFIANKTCVLLCAGVLSFFPYCVAIPFYEITPALLFMPYFLLGYAMELKGVDIQWNKRYLIPLAVMLLHGVFPLLFEPNDYIDPLSILCSVGLVAVIVFVSCRLQTFAAGNKLLACLRDGGLVLLATQNYIIGLCRVLLDKMTHTDQYLSSHFYCKPIVFLAVYAITIPLILLIRHYAPFLIGKRPVFKKAE